jgi:hypothetical protein
VVVVGRIAVHAAITVAAAIVISHRRECNRLAIVSTIAVSIAYSSMIVIIFFRCMIVGVAVNIG